MPADDLRTITDRIARAARTAGREDVPTLVAISKTRSPGEIAPLLDAGHRVFGENRVQEAQGKWPELKGRYSDVELHLVGQLQSNKVADAVALFDAIHAVDRPSLVDALAKVIPASGRDPTLFVQVNIGEEAQKGGCGIEELAGLLDHAAAAGLRIAGLMAIPPADMEAAPYFALLAKLRREHDLPLLSMGMSDDFETATMLGATHVRVGSALFGARA